MRIGIVQLDANSICAGYNRHFVDYADQAAASGCDMLVFPELSDCGYDLRTDESITPQQIDLLRSLAYKNTMTLLAGGRYAENQKHYNALLYFSDGGELISVYKKNHLFQSGYADEAKRFAAGNRLVCVDHGICKVGLAICFDLRFPGLYEQYMLAGASVLITIAAWPSKRIGDWRLLQQARALENQCFTVGVNYCGAKYDMQMGGHSMVCGPDGHIVAEADESSLLLICDLNLSDVLQTRKSFPVIDNARHGAYPCDLITAVAQEKPDRTTEARK